MRKFAFLCAVLLAGCGGSGGGGSADTWGLPPAGNYQGEYRNMQGQRIGNASVNVTQSRGFAGTLVNPNNGFTLSFTGSFDEDGHLTGTASGGGDTDPFEATVTCKNGRELRASWIGDASTAIIIIATKR